MLPSSKVLPDIHKIAVLRANGIGDYIFTLPALDALRTAYPDAEIVLLGQEWHAGFISGRPGPVNRVMIIPPCKGVSLLAEGIDGAEAEAGELDEFFTSQVEERYDLAFQLHGGGRYSNPFVRRLGAKLTVGLKSPDAIPLDRWIPYIYFQPEILRFLEVVSLVGATPQTLVPRLQLISRDMEEARAVIGENQRPFVVIHPGAGDARRRWAPRNFARVADGLRQAGFRVMVTGTAPERSIVAEVIESMELDAENLCGCLSLGGLAGLFASCALVVSNDSGPLHLAEAAGSATVGIYWCGNLINAAPVTRAKHHPIVSWRLDCPVCGRDIIYDPCDHRVSFVDLVRTEEVLSASLDLLKAPFPVIPGAAG